MCALDCGRGVTLPQNPRAVWGQGWERVKAVSALFLHIPSCPCPIGSGYSPLRFPSCQHIP